MCFCLGVLVEDLEAKEFGDLRIESIGRSKHFYENGILLGLRSK